MLLQSLLTSVCSNINARSTSDAKSTGLLDTMAWARVGGDHAPNALHSWALNDDSQAHGGREFPDLPQAISHLQSLLHKHSPLDGVLGIGQGG